MNANDLNWQDVHFFAVAARSDSYRQAAARLGTTHPTVRRRVASLEAATGFKLFQRDVPGLKPTLEGLELLKAASEAERVMEGFARRARAADAAVRGPITATMPISVALGLAPALEAFSTAWPEISLTIDTRPGFADLGAMEADVAIRAVSPKRQLDPSLAGRKAAVARQAVYGSPESRCWIASTPNPTWATSTPFPELPIRFVMPEPVLRLDACRRGLGLAILPCFVADPHLPRQSEAMDGYSLWVLVHPDMRDNPRLKLFREAMVQALRELSEALYA